MYRIGVLSDTHIPERMPSLPPSVFKLLSGVDRIFHAGDVVQASVLDALGAVAPVVAVRGNMDDPALGWPIKYETTIEGVSLGLIHGSGGPKATIRERIRKEFASPAVIVYGHTHHAFWGQEAGVWFLNPGSSTDYDASYRSLGMLTLEDGKIRGEIIRL